MKDAKGMHEEHKRSALKAVSWRIIATSTGMFLVHFFTGQLELTVGFGIGDVLLKILFYFAHERVWDKFAYGRTLHGTAESAQRTPPVTASPLETVAGVIQKMVTSDIGAVIVVEDDRPVGLITERDILARIKERARDPSKVFAKNIMSSPVVTVEYDQPLTGMLRMMRAKDIRRLAVTKNGKLKGIVTERRILNALV